MNQIQKSVLLLLSVAEILLLSSYRNYFGEFISPVILFLIGLSIGLVSLFFHKKTNNTSKFKAVSNKPWQFAIYFAVMVFGCIKIQKLAKIAFLRYPIDPKISDIIPLFQVMVNRAVHLWYPYCPFSDFGYELFPTYLPLHWAPFVVAEKLHLDFRNIANGIMFLSLGFLFFQVGKNKSISFLEKILLIALPLVSIYTFINYDEISIGVGVEQMMMGYYIILGTVLVSQKNTYIRSFAILLCLLSRYSFLFWLPLFLYSTFIFEGFKNLKKTIITVGLGVLLIYILPFMLKDPFIFQKGLKAYFGAIMGEWGRNPSPHLPNGLGLANFYFNFVSGENAHKVQMLQLTQISLSVLTILGLGFYLNKNKEKIDSRVFNTASLKIMIAIFYAFIPVPYSYLYFVPLGITFVVLFSFFKTQSA